MTKFFKKLHLTLGLVAGFFITISCLTGAILVFQTEIRELTARDRYYHQHNTTEKPLSLKELIPLVERQLHDDKLESIEISSDPTRNYIVGVEGKHKTQIFVDPYTAQVVGRMDYKEPDFFGYIFRLHRWLMDESRTWGKQIMGASTLLFVFILLSGIVYWWPKSKKQLKARLSINTKASRYRLLSDLHASLGIYCVIFLLLMALTGLTWSYPWYRSGLYAMLGIEMPKENKDAHKVKSQEKPKADTTDVAKVSTYDWDLAYSHVSKAYGEHRYIRLEEGKAKVKSLSNWGNVRAEDAYVLDKETTSITAYKPYEENKAADRARGWIYSLHVGAWGGIGVKILYFVVCLVGASFFPTGLWLYLKKRPKKKTTKPQ